jgi:hypothetical protein
LIEILYYYILHNSSPIIFYIICNVFAISYEISVILSKIRLTNDYLSGIIKVENNIAKVLS